MKLGQLAPGVWYPGSDLVSVPVGTELVFIRWPSSPKIGKLVHRPVYNKSPYSEGEHGVEEAVSLLLVGPDNWDYYFRIDDDFVVKGKFLLLPPPSTGPSVPA